MKKLKCLLLLICTICLFGCVNNTDKTEKTVYAESFDIIYDNNKVFVGDSISLNDIDYKILPTNATVKPIINIKNCDYYTIDNNNVTFIKSGQIDIEIKIEINKNEFLTKYLTFEVLNKPIFIENINFDNELVYINLVENNMFINKTHIQPQNYNQSIEIIYNHNNIDSTNGSCVSYDFVTGRIIAIKTGEEIVKLKYKLKDNTFATKSFKVIVENNVYAQDINYSINNKTKELYSFICGDSGKIKCLITPNLYNLEVNFQSLNDDLVQIDSLGNFVVKNKIGKGKILIKVRSGRNQYITKSINYEINKELKNLDFELVNLNTNDYYTNIQYELKFNSNININNFKIENYDLIKNKNKYFIEFKNSGLNLINFTYLQESDVNTRTVKKQKELTIFEPITNINISLINNNFEILPKLNVYNLYLFNKEFEIDANADGVFDCANLIYSFNTNHYNKNLINLSVVGNSISLQNNRIVALKEGVSKIIVNCNDINNLKKEIEVNVNKCVPNKIDNIIKNQTLYISKNSNEEFILNYSILPKYSIYSNVNITSDNDCVEIIGNKIIAKHEGKANIKISVLNLIEECIVNVYYKPDNLKITINNNNINNNDTLQFNQFEVINIVPKLYYNDILLDNVKNNFNVIMISEGEIFKYTDNKINTFIDIELINSGSGKLIFTFEDLTKFVVNINVIKLNKIISAKFDYNNLNINTFFNPKIKLKYKLTCEDNLRETTDKIDFKFSNDLVFIDKDNFINFNGVTNQKLKIEMFVNNKFKCDIILDLFYKEIIYAKNLDVNISNVPLKEYKFLGGDSGKINCSITPSNYNQAIIFKSNNPEMLVVDNEGNFVVNNIKGKGTIIVKVYTAENEFIDRVINYEIEEIFDNFNYNFLSNSNIINNLFVNTNYTLSIIDKQINLNNLSISNCNFKIVKNEMLVSFYKSGNILLNFEYLFVGDLGNKNIAFNKNIFIYNYVSGIDISLTNDTLTLKQNVNNEYELFLINNDYLIDAKKNNIVSSAELNYKILDENTLKNNIELTVVGNTIALNNNIINVISEGTSQIVIKSNDNKHYKKVINIKVSKVTPSKIILNSNNIMLYLNDVNNNINVNYYVLPKYALVNNIKIVANNNCVIINKNKITANIEGDSIVNVIADNIKESMLVKVRYKANNIKLKVNEQYVLNNNTINTIINDTLIIKPELYFNDILLSGDKYKEYNMNIITTGDVLTNINENSNRNINLNIIQYGNGKIIIKYLDIDDFIINVKCASNKIISATFNLESKRINTYVTTECVIHYSLQCENNNINTTDIVELRCNNNQLILANNIIKFNGITNCDIVISLYANNNFMCSETITLYYEEIKMINNITDFQNITSGKYIVNTDLDFSNFVSLNVLNAEIDFNNHSISNIKCPLFKTIETASIVKNVNIIDNINVDSSTFCIFTENNKGNIDNVKFDNVNMNLNFTELSEIALIATTNNGIINNINIVNMTINSVNNLKIFNGLVVDNNSIISNVKVDITCSNIDNFSTIAHLNHNQIINCVVKVNCSNIATAISGLVFKSFVGAIYKDINLEVTILNSSNVNYGGLINILGGSAEFNNCVVISNLVDGLQTTKVGLFIFKDSKNNILNSSFLNCKHNNLVGYNTISNKNCDEIEKI